MGLKVFQSLIGKIETDLIVLEKDNKYKFQSLIGKIETPKKAFTTKEAAEVSIPHR